MITRLSTAACAQKTPHRTLVPQYLLVQVLASCRSRLRDSFISCRAIIPKTRAIVALWFRIIRRTQALGKWLISHHRRSELPVLRHSSKYLHEQREAAFSKSGRQLDA